MLTQVWMNTISKEVCNITLSSMEWIQLMEIISGKRSYSHWKKPKGSHRRINITHEKIQHYVRKQEIMINYQYFLCISNKDEL
jgi:hypothetical protein